MCQGSVSVCQGSVTVCVCVCQGVRDSTATKSHLGGALRQLVGISAAHFYPRMDSTDDDTSKAKKV